MGVFGVMAMIALLALIYTFIQQAQARAVANGIKIELAECKMLTGKAKQEIEVANKQLEQVLIETVIIKETSESKSSSKSKKIK